MNGDTEATAAHAEGQEDYTDALMIRLRTQSPTEPVPLAGRRIGRLTCLFPTERYSEVGGTMWVCRCACGNYVNVPYTALIMKDVRSCGCDKKEVTRKGCDGDMSGLWKGMVHILRPVQPEIYTKYFCKCECGRMLEMTAEELTTHKVISCGCLERSLVGEEDLVMCSHHPLKGAWNHMLKKGDVCEEWEDYERFYNWAYLHGWRPGMVLCREDPKEGYDPDNCFWGSREDLAKTRARRRTRREILADGFGRLVR